MVPTQKLFLSNVWYDRLKWVAQIGLPAVGTLYFTIAMIYGLPAAQEIVGTIVALDTFLGAVLGLSSKQYNNSDERFDGVLEVVENDNRLIHTLQIATPPEELREKGSITFKVEQGPPVDL